MITGCWNSREYYYISYDNERKSLSHQCVSTFTVQNSTPEFGQISLGISASAEIVLDRGPLRDFQRNLSSSDRGTYSLAPLHSGATQVLRASTSRGGWKKKDLPCEFRPDLISLPGEDWRPVVGWERHYRVSNLGRLYSLHQTGRLVKGMQVRGGYRVLKLRDGERRAHAMTHRMVLEAFIGPAPQGCEGCHGRNGVSDNSLINLRWDTKKANQSDRLIDGTHNRGARCVSAVLTEDLVRQIRTTPEISALAWANRLGVSKTCVNAVRRRKTWVDVR